jgi:hypothetical protein
VHTPQLEVPLRGRLTTSCLFTAPLFTQGAHPAARGFTVSGGGLLLSPRLLGVWFGGLAGDEPVQAPAVERRREAGGGAPGDAGGGGTSGGGRAGEKRFEYKPIAGLIEQLNR